MGFVSAIVALLRAVPSLERLFLKIADGIKEANAKNRYDAKVDRIDALIDGVRVQHTTIRERGEADGDGGV
tara:strand:- start:9116 stop:9328 length:213 start_codon:yes stop_codon:yes gene_type:complete